MTEAELEELVDPVRQELRQTRIAVPAELTAAAAPLDEVAHGEAGDVLRLMYTSGTTARPKGVVITNGNLDAKCLAQLVELQLTAEDRALIAGPLYHVGALDLSFTTVLYAGGYQRILRRFDATAVLDAIESEALTTVWLAPAMVNAVMTDASLGSRDLSSMRVIIDGGREDATPVDRSGPRRVPERMVRRRVRANRDGRRRHLPQQGQGAEKARLGRQARLQRAGSRGRCATANPCRPARTGEIVIRGPKVCAGYWRDPEATARAMRDGWFHTGDIGTFDEDGYLYIVDRLKDIIISGGENIASLEVERVALRAPDGARGGGRWTTR